MTMSGNIEEDRQWARVASAIGTVLALDEQKRVPAGQKGGGQFTSGGGGASAGGKETKKAKTKSAASEGKSTPKVKEAKAEKKAAPAAAKKSAEKSKEDLTDAPSSSKSEASTTRSSTRATGPKMTQAHEYDSAKAAIAKKLRLSKINLSNISGGVAEVFSSRDVSQGFVRLDRNGIPLSASFAKTRSDAQKALSAAEAAKPKGEKARLLARAEKLGYSTSTMKRWTANELKAWLDIS